MDSNGESFTILTKIVIRTIWVHALIVYMRTRYKPDTVYLTLYLVSQMVLLQTKIHFSDKIRARKIYCFTIARCVVQKVLFYVTMLRNIISEIRAVPENVHSQ
jgi:hypothetical protein